MRDQPSGALAFGPFYKCESRGRLCGVGTSSDRLEQSVFVARRFAENASAAANHSLQADVPDGPPAKTEPCTAGPRPELKR